MADSTPVIGDMLVTNIEAEPQTLNPLTAHDAYEGAINGKIYESLLNRDKKTFEWKPWLATSWEISTDKLSYTFKLRQGVKWHDGQPLTVEDVKYSFDRLKDPAVDCPHLKVYFQNVARCEILDAETVRFVATKKYFKTLESVGGMTIIPKHIFENGADFNKHPAGRSPLGTGPYKFKYWKTGSEIALERNPDYWGETNYPGKLLYKILPEPTVTLQLFKRGDIDFYYRINTIQWVRQLSGPEYDSRFQKFATDIPTYSYIGFNLTKAPFDDVRVRRAIDHLIDREKIIAQVYQGFAKPTSGPFFINDPCYDAAIEPTKYDPARAAQLLDEAGWKVSLQDGRRYKFGRAFTFTFLLPSGSVNGLAIAQILKEELIKLGIDMDIQRLEWAVFLQRTNEKKFQMLAMSWMLSFDMDPYQVWHGSQAELKDSSNFIGYSNPKADALMDKAREEFDAPKRHAMYRKLHRMIYDDCPVVFVAVPQLLMAVDPRWHGITIYPKQNFDIGEWFVPTALRKYE
jgi:peptide/nickel transport system substrate-binding protein